VTTGTALALARLARRHGVTNQQMLERLITAADADIVAALDPTSPEWNLLHRYTVTGWWTYQKSMLCGRRSNRLKIQEKRTPKNFSQRLDCSLPVYGPIRLE
jgi:hypothetical protein